MIVVVMGVSGSGKTTIATLLAARLHVPFCEGDDLHPDANVAKMRSGQPLDDIDRAPWLARINAWMRDHPDGGVVSCSALKRIYRDQLSAGVVPPPRFILLDAPRAELDRRLHARRGHYMPAVLLDSQLATLERPAPNETVCSMDATASPDAIVDALAAQWTAR